MNLGAFILSVIRGRFRHVYAIIVKKVLNGYYGFENITIKLENCSVR